MSVRFGGAGMSDYSVAGRARCVVCVRELSPVVLMLLLLLLKVRSESCGTRSAMFNRLGCGSDGYRLAFALLRI